MINKYAGIDSLDSNVGLLDIESNFRPSNPESHIDFRYVRGVAGSYHLARANSGCLDYIAKDFIMPLITGTSWEPRKVVAFGKRNPYCVYAPDDLALDLHAFFKSDPEHRQHLEKYIRDKFENPFECGFLVARVKSEERMSCKTALAQFYGQQSKVGADVLGLRAVLPDRASARDIPHILREDLLRNDFDCEEVTLVHLPGRHFSYRLDVLHGTSRGAIPVAMQFMSIEDFFVDQKDHNDYEQRQYERLQTCAQERGISVDDLLARIKREIRKFSC